jgi:hypothetical protein
MLVFFSGKFSEINIIKIIYPVENKAKKIFPKLKLRLLLPLFSFKSGSPFGFPVYYSRHSTLVHRLSAKVFWISYYFIVIRILSNIEKKEIFLLDVKGTVS